MLKSQYCPLVELDEFEKQNTNAIGTIPMYEPREFTSYMRFMMWWSFFRPILRRLLFYFSVFPACAVFVQWTKIHWVWFQRISFHRNRELAQRTLTTPPPTTTSHTYASTLSRAETMPGAGGKENDKKAHDEQMTSFGLQYFILVWCCCCCFVGWFCFSRLMVSVHFLLLKYRTWSLKPKWMNAVLTDTSVNSHRFFFLSSYFWASDVGVASSQ